jgi:predicted DNA-binding protein (UPF0251 family)
LRPRKPRRIRFSPDIRYFKPRGVPLSGLEEIELRADELEAMRLKYVEEFDQHEGAKEMHISQSTFQRILDSANKKVAGALVNGMAIKIGKGDEDV